MALGCMLNIAGGGKLAEDIVVIVGKFVWGIAWNPIGDIVGMLPISDVGQLNAGKLAVVDGNTKLGRTDEDEVEPGLALTPFPAPC